AEARTEPAGVARGTQRDWACSASEVCQLVEKRYLRRGPALAVTASIALAACTQTPATSPAPSASASTAPVARGAGGDLKILYWQAPTILNGHQSGGTKDSDASRVILEPLAAFDNSGAAIPRLAAEIPTVANGSVSADLTTVTWKMKTGVKNSDGLPISDDVSVFTSL